MINAKLNNIYIKNIDIELKKHPDPVTSGVVYLFLQKELYCTSTWSHKP